ncbi:MAG: stage II sporulation protein P [Chloroflexota bacterium]
MFGLPSGALILLAVSALVVFGVTERVLDRMKMTDRSALLILAALIAGMFLPAVRITPTIAIDLGGAVVPVIVAIWLIATAGTNKERGRAIIAMIVTGAVVYASERFIPGEPGRRGLPIDIDPVWFPGIVAAIVGYIVGRSRRSAFIAGIMGVVLADLAAGISNAIAGRAGAVVVIGGAGAVDAVVIGGVLAVALAEAFGELREYLAGGPSRRRPDELVDKLSDHDNAHANPRRRRANPAAGALTAIGLVLVLVLANNFLFSGEGAEGANYQILDANGRVITSIGRQVGRGDRYLDVDNMMYRVYSVKGTNAWATATGTVDLKQAAAEFYELAGLDGFASQAATTAGAAFAPVNIGIYYTHNDESYVPSQGVPSQPRGQGGVHNVGAAFAARLKAVGQVPVVRDDQHYPHDAGAYRRSRSTAMELLKWRPAAIFDVHRDAGPASGYAAFVNKQWVTQIRLVVGRQNQNIRQNTAFALSLKGLADQMYPGLIKGIFFARGNYNQDLYQRALLLEVGTEKNSEEAAKAGITMFADVVSRIFGGK